MALIIADVKGIITSSKMVNDAEDMKIRDPEKWVELKNSNKLPKPYYLYTIDQHTGEGTPLQFKFKDYEIEKPMRPDFSQFEETCLISSWSFKDGRHGLSVSITDQKVRKVSMSFEDDKKADLKKVS